jgi:hypothetical protein
MNGEYASGHYQLGICYGCYIYRMVPLFPSRVVRLLGHEVGILSDYIYPTFLGTAFCVSIFLGLFISRVHSFMIRVYQDRRGVIS